MSDSEIRYYTAEDGVRIAYKLWGAGPPLVFLVPMPGSIELEMELPDVRAFYDALAQHHTLLRFDLRGTGASQRDVAGIASVETGTTDLGSLVDHLGFQRFALFGAAGAIATHPRSCTRRRIPRAYRISSFGSRSRQRV